MGAQNLRAASILVLKVKFEGQIYRLLFDLCVPLHFNHCEYVLEGILKVIEF